jgi:tetratricopeptide (TPR) repeat protein
MKAIIFVIVLFFVSCSTGDESQTRYQRGEILAEQNRVADAMREYLLSVEADDDAQYVVKALCELGRLSMDQHNIQQAHTYYEQALQMVSEQNDVTQKVLVLRDMGRLSRSEHQPESALKCFEEADSLILSSSADSLKLYVYPEYISLLMRMNRADDARQLVFQLTKNYQSGPSCLVAGRFYLEIGITDSAEYFFQRCMETDNVNSRASAAMYLGELAGEANDWEQAYGYAQECAALVDSAKLQMQEENANLVSSLARQLDVERENYRLYRMMAVVVFAAIMLLAIVIVYVRSRIARLKQQQEKDRQALVNRARSSQEQLVEQFRNTRLYRQILMDESVNPEQWEEIMAYVNTHADGFAEKLTAFYPAIKPQELQTCMLLKLEFTNQQIAAVLCKTQQAITNLRKRLFQKMFDKEGAADDLNQFLRLFPTKTGL